MGIAHPLTSFWLQIVLSGNVTNLTPVLRINLCQALKGAQQSLKKFITLHNCLKHLFLITATHCPCERPQQSSEHHLTKWVPFQFLQKEASPSGEKSPVSRNDSQKVIRVWQVVGEVLQKALREFISVIPSWWYLPAYTSEHNRQHLPLSVFHSSTDKHHQYSVTDSPLLVTLGLYWSDVPTPCAHPPDPCIDLLISYHPKHVQKDARLWLWLGICFCFKQEKFPLFTMTLCSFRFI